MTRQLSTHIFYSKTLQLNMVKIAVVGAGVMGLGSAVAIQEKCPDVSITIISERFSPFTTGDGAAGIWGPYLLGQTSTELIQ